jgi:hypothetical protein
MTPKSFIFSTSKAKIKIIMQLRNQSMRRFSIGALAHKRDRQSGAGFIEISMDRKGTWTAPMKGIAYHGCTA